MGLHPIGSGSGSRSGSGLRPISSKTKSSKPKKKRGGLLGAVDATLHGVGQGAHAVGQVAKHASSDIVDIAAGLPAIATTVVPAISQDLWDEVSSGGQDHDWNRTVPLAKAMAKSYADMYGPLAKGDIEGFLDNVYHHPVNFTLDAATVASLGLGAGVKAGVISGKAGKSLALLGSNGEVIATKPLARGELRAQLQSLGARIRNAERTHDETVYRPQGIYGAKTKAKQLRLVDKNRQAKAQPLARAAKKLDKSEDVASSLRLRYDRPALDAHVSNLKKAAANPKLREKDRRRAGEAMKVITSKKVQDRFDKPTAKMQAAEAEARALAKEQARISKIDPATAEARRFHSARLAHGAEWDDEFGGLVGGPSIAELKARGLDPSYLPDTPAFKLPTGYGGKGGGLGVPTRAGHTRQNRGVLRNMGMVVESPSTLTKSFLDATKYEHYNDIHEALLGMGEKADHIPRGYVAVRQRRGDRIPFTDKSEADFQKWVDETFEDDAHVRVKEGAQPTTGKEAEALVDEDGLYTIVPKQVAKQLTGEFTRTNTALYMLEKYPMRVWRALNLFTSPRYLVNNAVGNTLMYFMHSARPDDLRELAGAFKRLAGPKHHDEIDRILNERLASQVQGGFVATQFPKMGKGNKVTRVAGAPFKAIPAMDKAWEQALRRAKARAEIRRELKRNPKLSAAVERMGKDTAEFKGLSKNAKALEAEMRKDPQIALRIHDRVNDALGNYDHLSPFEKNVLRTLFPFYAWYRSISGIALGLVLEQPLKVNLLANMANIGIEQELLKSGLDPDNVPASLKGFLTIRIDPDGRVRGINTSGINPYATVGQLSDFVAAIATEQDQIGNRLPGPNPILTGLINQVYGSTPSGYPTRDIENDLAGNISIVRILDALANGNQGRDTFYDRDPLDEALRQAGIPYARVSPSAAKRVVENK